MVAERGEAGQGGQQRLALFSVPPSAPLWYGRREGRGGGERGRGFGREGRGLTGGAGPGGGAGLRRPRVLRGAACPGAAGAGVALSVSRAPGGLRFFSPLL